MKCTDVLFFGTTTEGPGLPGGLFGLFLGVNNSVPAGGSKKAVGKPLVAAQRWSVFGQFLAKEIEGPGKTQADQSIFQGHLFSPKRTPTVKCFLLVGTSFRQATPSGLDW